VQQGASGLRRLYFVFGLWWQVHTDGKEPSKGREGKFKDLWRCCNAVSYYSVRVYPSSVFVIKTKIFGCWVYFHLQVTGFWC
jgi:hypothetical protein